MGKMSELALLVDELKKCGEILIGISEGLTDLFSSSNKEKPVEETAKTKETEKPPTLEEVRAVLAEKSREGKTAAVKELLQKYGAEKLSEVDAANYAALLTDAEVL